MSETCPNKRNGQIIIESKADYNYKIAIYGIIHSFTNNAIVKFGDLEPKTYEFCISVTGEDYEQCYTVIVNSAKTVSGKSNVVNNRASIEIFEGTAPFDVFVNGKLIYKTMSNTFDVSIEHGDLIDVKTSISCEGVYSKTIDFPEAVVVYSNPSRNRFEIAIPILKRNVLIESI
ncbi:MAG: hypothetical protein COC22_03405 [Flavobacteriaceae bacterium]|nr:MAG: hypothetical protein COC22_03405 [Flavobacteriaceae bacterium]